MVVVAVFTGRRVAGGGVTASMQLTRDGEGMVSVLPPYFDT